jgi:hypothetical protein
MPSTTYIFEFSKAGRVFAYIPATNEKHARERTRHVNHLVHMPDDCIIRAIEKAIVGKGAIFFEEHLQRMDELFEMAESHSILSTINFQEV